MKAIQKVKQILRPRSTRTDPAMAQELVLITGATGFIGSQTALSALKAGYRVRLSVRKPDQIEKLKKLFSEFVGSLDFAVVSDFTAPDAFKSAVEGVDYIFHLASPMVGQGSDFQNDYVAPAVKGTESILFSAKEQPSIKRVIVMSSILGLLPLGALGWENLDFKGMKHIKMPLTAPNHHFIR